MAELILDSWPVLEWMLGREPAVSAFEILLREAQSSRYELPISRINYAEIRYTLHKPHFAGRVEECEQYLALLPLTIYSATDERVDQATEIKAHFSLSFADCFAAALAIERKAPLVTGDPEFRKLEDAGLIKLHWLGA